VLLPAGSQQKNKEDKLEKEKRKGKHNNIKISNDIARKALTSRPLPHVYLMKSRILNSAPTTV
jgi:hypothetical protein